MRRSNLVIAAVAAVVPLVRVAVVSAQVSTPVTVTFQEGVNGYVGTFDKRIGSDNTNQLGSSTPNYYVDGFNTSNSPDIQGLVRFDNIFGSASNQIPMGATILKASLQVMTNGIDPTTTPPGSVDAVSPGPWGVAGLLRSFDATTRYTDFSALGPTYRNGNQLNVSSTRATGYFDDSAGATTTIPNAIASDFNNGNMNGDEGFVGNVQPIVQAWAKDPSKAFGFTIQAGRTGTDNGWQIGTSSNPDLARRPKLSVTYTTDAVEDFSFQNGVNGYAGTTQNFLRQNNNSGPTDFLDASQTDNIFLDGPAVDSPDDRSMIKFDGLFAGQGGAIPADAEIVDAHLVVTTGVASTNARTGGAFTAHQMLTDWDLDRDAGSLPSVYGDFGGGNGPTEGVDFDAAAAIEWGMISDGQAWFDVTQIAKNWQEGDANFGIQLQAFMHADGWQIRTNGAAEIAARPQLVIRTLIPTSHWAADADGVWNVATSWQSERIASGAGRIASFGTVATSGRTVTLDADTTVGSLKFENATAGYTIAGTSTLTLDRASGTTSVNVLSGNHNVNVPVALAKSTVVDVAAASSVKFGVGITTTAADIGLSKVGAGELGLAGFKGTSLSVGAGKVTAKAAAGDAGTIAVNALSVTAGATLDLNDAALVVDYCTTSPLANVLAQIADGRITAGVYAGNNDYAIAAVEASQINGLTSFRGIAVDDTSVLVDATLRGDSNIDASVNFDDLLILAQNYNGTEKGWATGDSDGNGAVDFNDLLSLAKNYNKSAAAFAGTQLAAAGIGEAFSADFALAQSLVPEPTTLVMLPTLALLAGRRRRRQA